MIEEAQLGVDTQVRHFAVDDHSGCISIPLVPTEVIEAGPGCLLAAYSAGGQVHPIAFPPLVLHQEVAAIDAEGGDEYL
ncbi:MAG: hypothetical protein HY319_16665 [Armatimonadetes bacterium]|nr:hypothetical protein [Armatimonadota bacterium]